MPDRPDIWQSKTLGECGKWYSGGTPDTSNAAYWNGEIPWISASSLHDFYITDSERRVTEEGIQSGSRLMPADTIMFVVRGMSLKSEFRVGITQRPVAFGQDCKAIVPNQDIDPLFLANAIRAKSQEILGLVDEAGHGTGRLQTDLMMGLPIEVPPLPVQKEAVALIAALDEKIELNRHMNATLEALARALFQSWFVDFDPVRAKAEGRQPAGMDAATAALFPDRFETSALGEVPQGWRYGQLSELANITMGQSPPGDTYNETGEGLPFYQGTRDFGFRFPSRRVYCTAPTRYADADDVLLSVRAPVGSLNIATEKCAIGRGVASLTSAQAAPSFLYHALLSSQTGWQKFEAEGTVFGSVSKTDVHNFSALIPPVELVQCFETIAAPLDKHVLASENESQTLAELRDTLLPRLMSGEVRVRERVEPEGRTESERRSAEAYRRHLRPNDFWRRGRR